MARAPHAALLEWRTVIDVAFSHRQGSFSLDVSMQVPDSGVTGLFGTSGAGKSTVADAIAGLIRPDAGRIAIGETVLFDSARGVAVAPERRRIGYVFQEARLFPHMNVRANLHFGGRRRGAASPDTFEQVVGLLGLEPLLDRRTRHLSGGEAQRVAIGRALLSGPDLLIMDEPLSSLDQQRRDDVLPHLERLAADTGVPTVYITHSIEEIIRLADHLAVMANGTVLACGPIQDVMARPDLPVLNDRRDAGTILLTTVAGHFDDDHLSALRFGEHTLLVPRTERAEGSPLALRILARDVSLALEPPQRSSVMNVLPGTVTGIHPRGDGHVDVSIDSGQIIRARITRRSADDLSLKVGLELYALVKSVAFAERDAFRRHADGEG